MTKHTMIPGFLTLAGLLHAADLATETDLRAAILRGSGTHALTADIVLTADLPALPGGSAFNLDGRNHAISGHDAFSLFKCPEDATVLTLENLTLKNGYTSEHGAAVSSGQGIVVQRDIPGTGLVPILIEGSKTNRVIIRNCVLKDNVSAKSGGAVFVHLQGEPGQPYLLIENSALIGNTVLKGPSIPTFKVNAENNNGGAIWERVQSYQSEVIIRNTTLSGNRAPELAGAILVGESAGPIDQPMPVKLFHCTVVNNDAGIAGGAFWHDHSLLLDHSIVYDNSVSQSTTAKGANFAGPGPSLTIRWSDIGYRSDENGLPIEQRCHIPVKGYAAIWENNNLTVDPKLSPLPIFLAANSTYGAAYDTYVHIFDPAGPLYNAGDPGLVPGGSTLPWDQRGDPRKRIEFGRIDIGSYEYNAPLVNTPPVLSAIDPVRILEDHTGRITFTVSDKETAPESLAVTLDRKQSNKISFDQIEVNAGSRSITVRPMRDYNTSADGPQSVTVLVQDGLGAVAKQTFTLDIVPVNDKPWLRGPEDTLKTVPGFAVTHDFGFLGKVDRGDDTTAGLEKSQRLHFRIVDVAKPELFESLVLNADDGVVRLTPKARLTGNDTVRVRFAFRDDGGILNEGVDSSDVYAFYVVIQGAVVIPPVPSYLQADFPGLVSHSPISSPIPLRNAILVTDSNQSELCLNCPGSDRLDALGQMSPEGSRAGFRAFLVSLKFNAPVHYQLRVFTTLGTFFNQAEGDIDDAMLRSMMRDADGGYTAHLYWWPVTETGQQAATGSYIVRGNLTLPGPIAPPIDPNDSQNQDLRRRDISAIFGYLRR